MVGVGPNRFLAPIRFRSAFFTSRVRLSLLPLFPALLPHTPAAAGNAHQCPEGNGACDFELCDACFCFNTPSTSRLHESARSWRNGHETAAAASARGGGLPALVLPASTPQNTALGSLVRHVCPTRRLGTPLSSRSPPPDRDSSTSKPLPLWPRPAPAVPGQQGRGASAGSHVRVCAGP